MLVGQPAGQDEPDDGTDIHDEEHDQRIRDLVAGVGHDLRQPSVESVDQQESHEARCPHADGHQGQLAFEEPGHSCLRLRVDGAGRIGGVCVHRLRGGGIAFEFLSDEEDLGFGQLPDQEGHHDEAGDSAGEEEQVPIVGVNDGEQGDRDGAGMVAGHRQRRGLSGLARLVVFADIGERAGHHGTEEQSGNEPVGGEQCDVRSERDEQSEDAEADDAADDRPPSSDPVDDGADGYSAEADAHEAERGHHRGRLGGESEGLGGQQLGDDRAEDDEVEAFQSDGQPAQDGRPAARRGGTGRGCGWGGCGHRCLRCVVVQVRRGRARWTSASSPTGFR